MVIAIVMAGGRGARLNSLIPKQYIDVDGKAIIRNTVESILANEGVTKVKVIIRERDIELYNKSVQGLDLLPFSLSKPRRQDSLRCALNSLQGYDPKYILVHDAVRPFVSAGLVNAVLESLQTNKVVVPVVKIADSLLRVENNEVRYFPHGGNYCVQTPQGMYFKDALCNYNLHSVGNQQTFSDEGSFMQYCGINIAIIDGEQYNAKVTFKEDLRNYKIYEDWSRV